MTIEWLDYVLSHRLRVWLTFQALNVILNSVHGLIRHIFDASNSFALGSLHEINHKLRHALTNVLRQSLSPGVSEHRQNLQDYTSEILECDNRVHMFLL